MYAVALTHEGTHSHSDLKREEIKLIII